jgi:hypothetical protein
MDKIPKEEERLTSTEDKSCDPTLLMEIDGVFTDPAIKLDESDVIRSGDEYSFTGRVSVYTSLRASKRSSKYESDSCI